MIPGLRDAKSTVGPVPRDLIVIIHIFPSLLLCLLQSPLPLTLLLLLTRIPSKKDDFVRWDRWIHMNSQMIVHSINRLISRLKSIKIQIQLNHNLNLIYCMYIIMIHCLLRGFHKRTTIAFTVAIPRVIEGESKSCLKTKTNEIK